MSYRDEDLFLPAGRAADGADPVLVTPESASWTYSGLRILELGPGDSRTFTSGTSEVAVLPLS